MDGAEALAKMGIIIWFCTNLLCELCSYKKVFGILAWHGALLVVLLQSGIFYG
ncbi:hypothetical protein P3551_23100 [Vibrio parahaemolyticus]|uniref:hypothetical protein n=1 Tax=Vibrio parahaemolyticus TaxID=670 RepID=UPI0015DF31CF|nr:hypothetical protein [Vibrio parahaemolyticus]MBE3985617.1 hypothetical protein [Vibrio parahaemolyticus]MBE4286393.1 hypothetical protein [Vibrio parahaemolyticus]MDF4902174.1 hypothetical protein [Vibrio parahaemolyticus]HCG7330433.1 hypothetical protein [Vibrio parahaemolyticus]HCG8859896.1 hypothetical protein [Vibrio parahaemolyticus]